MGECMGCRLNKSFICNRANYIFVFIRALDDQEINNIRSKTLLGADVELIFPESDIGQAMRWSNFKFRNADEIYNIVSNFVFPAIKAMKHGKLPDFDEHGKLIPIPDTDETKAGFDFLCQAYVDSYFYSSDCTSA